jgi:TolB-like protein/predicted Zn-dependent protease
MGLLQEIKRRNVDRIAIGYVAGSWLLMQVADTLFPVFDLGNEAARILVIVLAIGFFPAVAISWFFEWTPAGLVVDAEARRDEKNARAAGKKLDYAIITIFAVAVVYFAIDKFVVSPQREAELIASATEAGAAQALEDQRQKAAAIPHESVAVLPFINISGDKQNEYFSDGLTETLLHMLAQFADLKVAARTSAFTFKGREVDIRDVANQLGVAHVLEGSVQKSGNRVRVSAQLIRANDGFHSWSKNYDRTIEDIFAIQDEIATDVAIALGSSLLGEQKIFGVFTGDAGAYDIYLQGLEQQSRETVESIEAAERLFYKALELDPDFVDAELALVKNYILKHVNDELGNVPLSPRTAELLGRVLEKQPDNLAARLIDLWLQANAAYRALDREKGDRITSQMLPVFDEGYGDSFVRRYAANYLADKERFAEALDLLRDALVVDPLNVDLLVANSQILRRADRPEEALQPLATAIKVQPGNPMLYLRSGYLEASQNRIAQSLDFFRKAAEADLVDPFPALLVARTLNKIGMYDESNVWINVHRGRAGREGDIMNLEAWTARRRGDGETLRRIVPQALDRLLRGETKGEYSVTNLCVILIHYSFIMHEDNRSQEALDYLEKFYPGASSLTADVALSSREMFNVHTCATMPLIKDVTERNSYEETFRKYWDDLTARGFEYERSLLDIVRKVFVRDIEFAKDIFFEHFGEDSTLLGDWGFIVHYPWLADFREDPDVAASIAAREERLVGIRKEVRAMMDRPEWQRWASRH